jgi:hypothetical protein
MTLMTQSTQEYITIVSGLPRSGTSMMMAMLEATGFEILADGIRTADEDNPKGYYEFERIKQIKTDKAWLPDAKGKVVKGISQLLLDLPPDYHYKVVFMRRDLNEVLASQKKMLIRRGTLKEGVADAEMRALFLKHLDHVTDWLRQQKNFDVLYVNYNKLLTEPDPDIVRLNEFFGGTLDTQAMRVVIDANLYRNRRPSTQP